MKELVYEIEDAIAQESFVAVTEREGAGEHLRERREGGRHQLKLILDLVSDYNSTA